MSFSHWIFQFNNDVANMNLRRQQRLLWPQRRLRFKLADPFAGSVCIDPGSVRSLNVREKRFDKYSVRASMCIGFVKVETQVDWNIVFVTFSWFITYMILSHTDDFVVFSSLWCLDSLFCIYCSFTKLKPKLFECCTIFKVKPTSGGWAQHSVS